MKVWIVFAGKWEPYIVEIFSTEEKAREFISVEEKVEPKYHYDLTVEEWEMK